MTSEHFHALVSAAEPCWRTTVTEGQASVELFDLTDGDIVPCIRVVSQMGADGSLGPVDVTVDPDEDFTPCGSATSSTSWSTASSSSTCPPV